MTLMIRAVALHGNSLSKPIEARFAQPGGTIGRSNHNLLTLPDPERHISRIQAEIVVEDDGCLIRNVGSANPIMVRGRTVPVGATVPLLHGDRMRIGGYALEVIELQAFGEPAPMRAAVPVESSDRRAALPDAWPKMSEGPETAPGSGSKPGGSIEGAAEPIPIDEPAVEAKRPRPFEGLLTHLDDESSSDDPLLAFLENRGTPPFTRQESATRDSDRAPLDTEPIPLGQWPGDAVADDSPLDPAPTVSGELTWERPLGSRHGDGPVVPTLVSADTEAMWRAFCEGAGLRLEPAGGPNPALMRMAGTLLRNAIDGTLKMVEVRSALRYELHAQVTVIKPRNNNPLKFATDATSALEQLLQPPLRGFLPGPAAMADVMHDLVSHAIGTVAGTRAALEGVLTRFAPDQLEAQLTDPSVLDSVLPMNRKAKLWELYLQHYGAIRDEAQQDFHALFGKAFLEAYEEQLERLKHEKPGDMG